MAMQQRARGFTVVELMVVLAIFALVAALAMPNLDRALTNQRLRNAATDFVSALLLARSEAIKRGVEVQVAPLTPGDWKSGWRIVSAPDNEQVERTESLGHWVDVEYAPDVIAYQRSGRLAGAGVSRIEFRAAKGSAVARCVWIDPSGVPRLTVASCS
jgi:prepilin-type N-terminal cleavage/methylation domain-containing protein